MSRRAWFSRALCIVFGACLAIAAEGCTDVVSLDPAIAPDEAIALPRLLGDWVAASDSSADEADAEDNFDWVRVSTGPDASTYTITPMRLTPARRAPIRRGTTLLRVVPLGRLAAFSSDGA